MRIDENKSAPNGTYLTCLACPFFLTFALADRRVLVLQRGHTLALILRPAKGCPPLSPYLLAKTVHRTKMGIQQMIPRKVWYGLESKSYLEIAQKLPESDDSLRRWIAIYAVYQIDFINRRTTRLFYDFLEIAKNSNYVSIELSIPRRIFETRDSIDDSDITITKFQTLKTEEEINSFPQENSINPDLFTPPWTCDYPLD